MIVRPLKMEEMIYAEYNRSICFKMPNDFDKCRQQMAEGSIPMEGRWGAFDEDGTLMSYIIDNPFKVYYDGHVVSAGGIGSVTTLPEYRNTGAVRQILTQILIAGRENGQVFSMLGPFSVEFYRKFGYEVSCAFQEHTFPVKQLAGYKHTGWSRRIHMSEEKDLSGVCEVIEKFSHNYNMNIQRDEEFMRRRWYKQTYEESILSYKHAYLLGNDEGAKAYLMYEFSAEGATLRVLDVAYDGMDGLHILLGFLARMSADYAAISIRLPDEVYLPALIPDAATIRTHIFTGRMLRVVNVQKALELAKKPDNLRIVVEVEDQLLTENSGRYLVTNEGVEKTDLPADLTADIRVFSQLMIGYMPLSSALMRKDIVLHGNREQLERFFVKKPMFQWEHF